MEKAVQFINRRRKKMQNYISKIFVYKLKEFQLDRCWSKVFFYSAPDVYDISILFVRNVQNANLSFLWDHKSNSFYMDIHIFSRWAMPYIY